MLTVSGSPMQRCCCASASQTATFRVASSRNTRHTCTSTRARQRLCTATGQSGSAATATVPTLIYFNIPGRGEIARLCFTLGGVEYKEKTIPLSEWPSFKPTTPFGQVPLLQIGDTIVAQSAAIDHYAARLGGFIPGDPVQALLADQAYFFVTQDIHAALISPTMKLKGDEGVQKRAEIAAGSLQEKLVLLDKLVASKPGQFIAGDTLTIGDFAIFNFLGMIKSEFWSGIPSTAFDDHAALKEFRNQLANEARVEAFYSKATDKLRVMGYRPDKPL